jgi:hypothetical protein
MSAAPKRQRGEQNSECGIKDKDSGIEKWNEESEKQQEISGAWPVTRDQKSGAQITGHERRGTDHVVADR